MNWKIDRTLFLVLFGATMIIGGMFVFLFTESRQCLANPYVYAAAKMEGVQCTCFKQSVNSLCPAEFFFNSTSFVTKVTNCGTGNEPLPLNISFK